MRRIYIDIGANVGETVARHMDKNPGTDIYAFEPNPSFTPILMEKFADKGVFISNKAAWIIDGVMPLYLGHELSSTLMKGKKALEGHEEYAISYERYALVPTFDFAKWLLDHISPSNHVEVKIDIEGAEYKVLQRLIDTDAIDHINLLKCEFHHDRFPVTQEEHDRIVNLVQQRTELEGWK